MREAMNASALKDRAEQLVRRELTRCEAALGPEAWARHGEWVTAFVVTSAKEWLVASARKGAM